MIVCHCRVVSDRDIAAAVADGARTVSAVCRATEAAQDCGSCIFAVKKQIVRQLDQECLHLREDGAAS